MRIMITGGAGFIGSELVRQAVAAGYGVTVLDKLTYAGRRENLDGVKAELVVGDIADGALVEKLVREIQPAAILNVAAETHVDNSIAAPGDFVRTNIQGVYTLLEVARAYWGGLQGAAKDGFRFLQVSTDEVFGMLEPEDPAFKEEHPYRPNSPYSASKAAGDHLVRAWHHTYGLPVLTTYCSNNYGPRQFPEKLIPFMIGRALAGQALPVYGDGKQVRDWIHVQDHAAGILLTLAKGRPGETYAFGGRAERANMDVVRVICGILDELSPRADGKPHATGIAHVTDRPGHDRRYAINDDKAQTELGFARKHSFETGLRNTVEWYLRSASALKAA